MATICIIVDMSNKVLNFIHRRFPIDCHWLDGNCYYFAIILKNRFAGTIYYDVIDGHFVTKIGGKMYDWSGIVDESGNNHYVEWDKFDKYDSLVKGRVVEGCIM